MKKFVLVVLCLLSINLFGCSDNTNGSNGVINLPEKSNIWEKSYYVDEFNNPTEEAYLYNTNYIIGTFSNSATTNSRVHVTVIIDHNNVGIQLIEYGHYPVKGYSTVSYKITMQDDNGKLHDGVGILYKNADKIRMTDFSLVELLQKNEEVKVSITELSQYGYNTKYLFTVKNGDFNSEYQSFA